ncbi:hypothetical protein [Intestinibacter sp.]
MKIKCGELNFEINYDKQWRIPENVKKFEVDEQEQSPQVKWSPELYYNIEFKNEINKDERPFISTKEDLIIAKDSEKNLETRYMFIKGSGYPYAKYTELSDNQISVKVLENYKEMFDLDTMFWSLFALERHMIQKNSVVLHCSYNLYKNHAILFSGPSGIGKSTQANLWKQNRGSKIINGDKCLLRKINGSWHADGWPICGSSEICLNEKHKLGTIVFLKQGKENKAVKLSKMSAVKKIMSQLTVNYWNMEFVDEVLTLAEDIVGNINVYELTCTPDVDAVEELEKVLKEDESWMV